MTVFPETLKPPVHVVAMEGCTPVPEREDVCGLPDALSETDTDAERTPAANGVNVMVIVQDAPLPKLEPTGQLFDWKKSAAFVPPIEIDASAIAAVPVFCKVSVCGALVFEMLIPPKLSELGDNDATGMPMV